MRFKVNEVFASIQGEGLLVGTPMNFIRFCRCNLQCLYCDTDFREGIEMSVDEITKQLNERFRWVSLTGGESMLEENLMGLVLKLKDQGFKILLETNGTLFDKKIFDACDFLSVDVKGPSSENPGHSEEVFNYCLKNSSKSQLKVVIQNNKDFEFFQKIYREEYPNWILQPEWNSVKTLDYSLIMDRIDDNVRIIPQVHKFMGLE